MTTHKLSPSGINLPASAFLLPVQVNTEPFTDVPVGSVDTVLATITQAAEDSVLYMVTGYVTFVSEAGANGSYSGLLTLNGNALPTAGRVDVAADGGAGTIGFQSIFLPNSDFAVGAGVLRMVARAFGGPTNPTASGELSLYRFLPS